MQFKVIYFCIGCVLVGFLACCECTLEEDKDDDKIDGIRYSGITQTDEEGHFLSIDPDDWRDDGSIKNCYAYPNPTGYYTNVQWKCSEPLVWAVIRNSKGEYIRKCDAKSLAAAVGGTIEGESVVVNGGGWECTGVWSGGIHSRLLFLDFRIVEKLIPSEPHFLYKQLPQGIYRVFIYATDNEVTYKQLRDLGEAHVSRDKYSVVYGDIQFDPGPPAKIERTDPPDGGEMPPNGRLKMFFDAPIIDGTVNDFHWHIRSQGPSRKYWEWSAVNLPQGAQTLKIKWQNYDGTEGSHSISVTVK